MSKTKRKVITKTVIRKELIEKEKQFFYSRGAQDAIFTVLIQHQDLIQLKDLCQEYEKTFNNKHPSRNWHLYRNQPPTDQGQSDPVPQTVSGTGEGNDKQAGPNDSDATKPTPSDQEEKATNLPTDQVTGGQEGTQTHDQGSNTTETGSN